MSNQLLNPKIDVIFRKLFGSDESSEYLVSLINSVDPNLNVTGVIIKNPFNMASYKGSKESILDIKAVDQNGRWYDVEMQIHSFTLYGKRAVYYLCMTFAQQLESGEDYSTLNTTIGIHFLDFKYFDDDRFIRQYALHDVETLTTHPKLDHLRLYFIEMGKFDKDWPQVRTALERWVAFLNRAMALDRNALPAQVSADPVLVKAVAELERMGLDPDARIVYESEVAAQVVSKLELETAKEEGLYEGIQLGRQEGRQEGRQDLLVRLLTRRIGTVPPNVMQRLNGLGTDELNELGEALFDLTSYDDIEAWFTRH